MSALSDYTPSTARHRLRYWTGIDGGLDAMALVAGLNGKPHPIEQVGVRNAMQMLIMANIRLARAQLAVAQSDEVTLEPGS
ncbi:hypothetical protein AWL63_19160 [Sphingomonas panacis]|uniref:Uncharacterized protein n=1 Tax=Sphingomonas panacis TaxID=1560345 RepID=A0A1B3ZE90_9SPHN|nr:hypothetical protein [Sphingomonas panacis]AOH85749.1 hypothetical protein AWL63_19160 [Sphingomonas panacis]